MFKETVRKVNHVSMILVFKARLVNVKLGTAVEIEEFMFSKCIDDNDLIF